MAAGRVFGGTCRNNCTVNTFGMGGVRVIRNVAHTTGGLGTPIVLRYSTNTHGCTSRNCLMTVIGTTTRRANLPVTLRLSRNPGFRAYGSYVSNNFASIVVSNSSLPFRRGVTIAGGIIRCTRTRNIIIRNRLNALTNIRSSIRISTSSTFCADPRRTCRFIGTANISSLTVTVNASRNTCGFGPNRGPRLHFSVLGRMDRGLPNFPVILRNTSSMGRSRVGVVGRFNNRVPSTVNVPRSVLHGTSSLTIYGVGISSSVEVTVATTLEGRLSRGPARFSPHRCLAPTESLVRRIIRRGVGSIFNSSGGTWSLGRRGGATR